LDELIIAGRTVAEWRFEDSNRRDVKKAVWKKDMEYDLFQLVQVLKERKQRFSGKVNYQQLVETVDDILSTLTLFNS
jgi:hypothetical protein